MHLIKGASTQPRVLAPFFIFFLFLEYSIYSTVSVFLVWCSAACTRSGVCCTRSGVTQSTNFVVLYLCLMCQSRLHTVLWSHIGLLFPLQNLAVPQDFFFPSQSLSGMIWLTPYLMVWGWWVSRAGPMPFCWLSSSLLFCLQLFSLSFLFIYRLVVWGWGLWSDRVSISLSRPCIANLF